MQQLLDLRKLPKPPKPRIRLNTSTVRGATRWICSLIGAKLNVGFGDTPAGAYHDWYARHGRHEMAPPDARSPRARSFNSDDRL